jgi:hypothetical protein
MWHAWGAEKEPELKRSVGRPSDRKVILGYMDINTCEAQW